MSQCLLAIIDIKKRGEAGEEQCFGSIRQSLENHFWL